MIAAALAGLLSDRVRGGRLHVVDSFGLDKPSTKAASGYLAQVAPSKKVLVVLDRADQNGLLSVRNLQNVHVLAADQLNAYDVVTSDDVVFTKAGFDAFVAMKTGSTQEVSA
jgi:large subunit ribosomal protein L4